MKRTHYQHRVTNSWGVIDAFRYIRKNNWFDIGKPLDIKTFRHIIRRINQYLAEEFLQGESVKLPLYFGQIGMRKKTEALKHKMLYINKNGKLVNNLYVNWNATRKLWKEDSEAREKKLLIRFEAENLYTPYYDKRYTQRGNPHAFYYSFQINKVLIRKFLKAANENPIETFSMP